jgi:hypothetical protein
MRDQSPFHLPTDVRYQMQMINNQDLEYRQRQLPRAVWMPQLLIITKPLNMGKIT